MRVAADVEGGIKQLARTLGPVFVLQDVVEQIETIAGLHALFEVDVVGVNFQELGDEVIRQALRFGGAIGAEIDAGTLARVFV